MAAQVTAAALLAKRFWRIIVAGIVATVVAVMMMFVLVFGAAAAVFPGTDGGGDERPGGGGDAPSGEIGGCAPDCEGADGPQAGLSVKDALNAGLGEVGQSFPTGWNQPGECIISVQRWIAKGGGNFSPGGVVTGYLNSPALRVTDGSLRPGDVIQYENDASPDTFLGGVHTYMVLGVHDDGTHDVLEANNPGGSGLVGTQERQKASPPPGFKAVVWRFAKTPDV